ncbi:ADAMTS-like protein 5 isoform X2 [Acinonyx jubatus]|uniref:ADAMTS-like protein 5 isoform X2 n=1 Tax=Acinonyx jubatus TaxID=32536 RepID=A0ABM3PWZ2_ACIJB|nr:ADAMTS-like protein 5 isoform X2 [Acinonyx jubatus]
MGKLRPGDVEWLALGHPERDENRGPERLNDCPTSHSQWAQSWGSDPGLLAPPLPRPLCSPTPRPLQNLLLLWTLLNCGLGGSAQGPGEWTPWGSWSRCSSSCGRGVSVRSRRCIWLPGLDTCWGDTHEYRLCHLPDCPPGAIPFRDLQCALYNGHPVLGTQTTYQWVPFYGEALQGQLGLCARQGLPARLREVGARRSTDPCGCELEPATRLSTVPHCQAARKLSPGGGGGASDTPSCSAFTPNQCDLHCLAEGHAFYHTFGRVLDGTPCSPGAQGLCVAGRCLSAGCDGLLGSDAREDHCGRCGGANESCLFVQRVFRDSGAFAGYWNVTLIPEGARHIRVAHRSRNHLALIGVDGRHVLNGNWAVSPPGTYEAAGTRVVYTRAAGPEETLRAAGPTSQDLLLQEPNPGIEFEFWLPRERYGPFQAQAQALGWSLRQPQPREVEPQPAEAPAAPAAGSPRTAPPAPDPCSPCPDTRGRAHRLLHYCGGDFVFRARVLSRLQQAQETRYEVRVQLIYKNRSPLRALEYVWALGRCPCPRLDLHREYLLAVQRLISPDGTQDRLLLPHTGYARAWSPAEDSRVRLAARHCPA